MLRLFVLSFQNHFSAFTSQPGVFVAAVIGMLINNILFLTGLWTILFREKPENQGLLLPTLCLTTIGFLSWGLVNVFLGGLGHIGEAIDNGTLEPMMGTPRSTLFLQSLSASSMTSLADIIQGCFGLMAIGALSDLNTVLRTALAATVAVFGFSSIFIFSGTFSFFTLRGQALGTFFVELGLTSVCYPLFKITENPWRWFLYFTPIALVGTLPVEWVLVPSFEMSLKLILASALAFWASLRFFAFGLKRYRSSSLTQLRS